MPAGERIVSGRYEAVFNRFQRVIQLTQFKPALPTLRIRATPTEMTLELGSRHFSAEGAFRLTKSQATALAEILNTWADGDYHYATPVDTTAVLASVGPTSGDPDYPTPKPPRVPGGGVVASRGTKPRGGKGSGAGGTRRTGR